MDKIYCDLAVFLLLSNKCLNIQESRKHLSRLESIGGLGSLVKDISNLEEKSERFGQPGQPEGKVLLYNNTFTTGSLTGKIIWYQTE